MPPVPDNPTALVQDRDHRHEDGKVAMDHESHSVYDGNHILLQFDSSPIPVRFKMKSEAAFAWIEPKSPISWHGFHDFFRRYSPIPILMMKVVLVFGIPVVAVVMTIVIAILWSLGELHTAIVTHCLLICAYGAMMVCACFSAFWLLLPLAYLGDRFQTVRVDIDDTGIISQGSYPYEIIKDASISTHGHGSRILSLTIQRTATAKPFVICRNIAENVDATTLLKFIRERIEHAPFQSSKA
jgi:hypothetical protein